MPTLKNTRRELFCGFLANGMSQSRAYIEAGYGHGKPSAGASILARKPEIVERVAEIREERATAAGTHHETNADDLEALSFEIERSGKVPSKWIMKKLATIAVTAGQKLMFRDATRALELLGREVGLFGDKLVVPPPFDPQHRTRLIPVDRVNTLLADIGFEGTVDIMPAKVSP